MKDAFCLPSWPLFGQIYWSGVRNQPFMDLFPWQMIELHRRTKLIFTIHWQQCSELFFFFGKGWPWKESHTWLAFFLCCILPHLVRTKIKVTPCNSLQRANSSKNFSKSSYPSKKSFKGLFMWTKAKTVFLHVVYTYLINMKLAFAKRLAESIKYIEICKLYGTTGVDYGTVPKTWHLYDSLISDSTSD